MIISTVCYLTNDKDWLMLYRNSKKNDVNHGKWIGVGGKVEAGEAPLEAAKREIAEETSLIPDTLQIRGVLTFIYADREAEYIFVCKGHSTSRAFGECTEGQLAWIPEDEIMGLALWPGDRLFLPLLLEEEPFFSLKLVYDSEDQLIESIFE